MKQTGTISNITDRKDEMPSGNSNIDQQKNDTTQNIITLDKFDAEQLKTMTREESEKYIKERESQKDEEIKKLKNTEDKENPKKIEEKKEELFKPETPEKKESAEKKETKENKEVKEIKEVKEVKEVKETKEEKEIKEETPKKPEKTSKNHPKSSENNPQTSHNRSLNPFRMVQQVAKKTIGLVSTPLQVGAVAAGVLARPQALRNGQFRKDIGTNIGRGTKSFFQTFSGLVYKKHRESVKYESLNKNYGESRSPKKGNAVQSFFWTVGKFAGPNLFQLAGLPIPPIFGKFVNRITQGTLQAVHETLDSIQRGKTDYSGTKESFKKAFKLDYTGPSDKK